MQTTQKRITGAVAISILVLSAVLVGLFWSVGGERSGPSPTSPESPSPEGSDSRRVTSLSTPSASDAPSTTEPKANPAPDDAEPTEESDRPPPASPEEEGLFALADASGESVVRCPLDAFPEGFRPAVDDVVVDGVLTRMITPNQGDDPEFTVFPEEPPFMLTTTGAFPGTIGTCSISPGGDDFALLFSPEQAANLGNDVDDVALDALDDADDDMHPAQVALDDPALSDGARAWLQARLDADVRHGEAVLVDPTDPDDVLDAVNGVVVEPDAD